MSTPPARSWAKVVQGQKRSVKEQLATFNRSTKKGPYVPSEGWLKFVTSARWFQDTTRALPKSPVPHGVRVNFKGDPDLFQEAAKAVKNTYPRAVSLQQSPLKDFFDLGFPSKEAADLAAEVTFTIPVPDKKGHIVQVTLPTTRTRFNQDRSLFISFEGLPLDMSREEVEGQLRTGLAQYGEIVQFELLASHYMPHLTTAKAMAMINPFSQDDVMTIPRRATLFREDGTPSGDFKVFPEQTPPICTLCNAIGHREALCPSTVAGVRAAAKDEAKGAQEDPAPGSQSNALKSIPWGTTAEYVVIAPITSRQKRDNAKATTPKPQTTDPNSVPIPTSQPIEVENEPMQEHQPAPQSSQTPQLGTKASMHAPPHLELTQSWAEIMEDTPIQSQEPKQVEAPQPETLAPPKTRGKTARSKKSAAQAKLSEVVKSAQYVVEADKAPKGQKKNPVDETMDEGGPAAGGATLA